VESLKELHLELKTKTEEYIDGKITAAELKHYSAPFGIYQQRNDLFMARIRVPGGHISVRHIRKIAEAMDTHNVAFAHLTTRQDIQLHDMKPEMIYPAVRECTENGLPFKGGGGNTYRNALVSSDSGLSLNEAFDVFPCAKNLNEYILGYEKAFDLPRKLKIGFSSGNDDSINAAAQDLGFIAKIIDKCRGFEVYGGGGMGRESMIGVKLFDFLPESQLARCAKAMIDLFYDHGDRTNRNNARLRFVLKKLGEQAFVSLFNKYFEEADAELPDACKWDIFSETERLTNFSGAEPDSREYSEWLKYAVSETRFKEIVSIKLFVPCGNLAAAQLRKIADLADICGCSFLRLTQTRNIILPLLRKSALPRVFAYLKSELGDVDLLLGSFKGHIISCIGAAVCKIGIIDSPSLADMIASNLDNFFKDNSSKRAALIPLILETVRISGCPNACSGHPGYQAGLQGLKKKINDSMMDGGLIFSGGSLKKECRHLAETDGEFVCLSKIPEKILDLIPELK